MNKKLIKTITSITCGLGMISSIPFVSTNCSCSKNNENYSMYDFNSVSDLFNFNPKNYVNFSLDPNKDYTDGDPEVMVSDSEYPQYLKNVTTDLLKEENIEKTCDFFAFSLLAFNLYCIHSWITGDDSVIIDIQDFNDLIKQNVKNFSLHISRISDFESYDADGNYDTFGFSCSSEMKLRVRVLETNTWHDVVIQVNVNKKRARFDQFGADIRDIETEQKTYHCGIYFVELQPVNAEDYLCSRSLNVDGHITSESLQYFFGAAIFPTSKWLNIYKDLQVSKSPSF